MRLTRPFRIHWTQAALWCALALLIVFAAACAEEPSGDRSEGGLLDNPIAVEVHGDYLFVTNGNFDLSGAGEGFLSVIEVESAVRNPGKDAVVARRAFDPYLADIAIDHETEIAYVANRYGNEVSLIDISRPLDLRLIDIDPDQEEVQGIDCGEEPYGVALGPTGVYLYATNLQSGDVSVIDLDRRMLARNIVLASGVVNIAMQPESNYAYVTNRRFNAVSVLDLERNTFLTSFSVGGRDASLGADTRGVGFLPDGSRAYIAVRDPASLMVVDTSRIPQFPDDAVIKYIQTEKDPTGVAVTPDGSEVWVTNYSSKSVAVVDTQFDLVIAVVDVGRGATDIAFTGPLEGDDADQYYVFVTDFESHSLAVIDGKAKELLGSVR